MYKSLILTVTVAILSSFAHGEACNANLSAACTDFCLAAREKYKYVICGKFTTRGICKGTLIIDDGAPARSPCRPMPEGYKAFHQVATTVITSVVLPIYFVMIPKKRSYKMALVNIQKKLHDILTNV